jgi:hypothetical protein
MVVTAKRLWLNLVSGFEGVRFKCDMTLPIIVQGQVHLSLTPVCQLGTLGYAF